MVNINEVSELTEATHIYVFKQSEELVEGISGGSVYKLNEDKRTVVDDDGEENKAWNMTDYALVKIEENIYIKKP